MIVELLAGGVGLAAIAGVVYAMRTSSRYADQALAQLEARRVSDVSVANITGDLRVADANTASFRRVAERERIRSAALEEVARRVSSLPPDALSPDDHGVDLMLAALRDAASLAPPEPLRAIGDRPADDAGDRLPGDRGSGASGDATAGPATVPGA